MIDVHAHASAPTAAALAPGMIGFAEHVAATSARYRDPLTAAHADKIGPRWDTLLADVDARLDHMDSTGIETQVVSVNPGQYHHWAEPDDAAILSRAVNDDLGTLVAAAPDRFLALGSVALQHPDLAAQQVHDALDRSGFVGVQISTRAGHLDLSDRALDTFWTAAEQRGAVVFVHPLGCQELVDRLSTSYLNNVVGQPVETTIALSHLIFGGVLDRHPRLRLVAAHGGGYLPTWLGRSEHAYRVRPDSRTMEHPPGHYLRRMWFDLVVHSPHVLRALIDTVGIDRVVVGTDYPFDMGVDDPAGLLDSLGLPDQERTMLGERNAVDLLSLTSAPS